jgi:hypothetical protein
MTDTKKAIKSSLEQPEITPSSKDGETSDK